MIIDIKSNKPLDRAIVGNKAYQLNQLYRLGYSICNGVVITPKLFGEFCKLNQINLEQDNLSESILDGSYGKNVYMQLKEVFETLITHSGAIIVRSSSLKEDNKDKSYAGIYKSVNNVTSLDSFLLAIKRVWSSYYSETTNNYDNENNRIQMPVLIQEVEFCNAAGVMFSRNPVNHKSECVIEACSGNNEKIIMNKINAERHILTDKKSIKSKKRLWNNVDVSLLKRNELILLFDLAMELEEKFEFPCDIEWGIKNKKVILFQIRPMVYRPDTGIYHHSLDASLDCILLDRYANPATVCYLSLLNTWQNKVYLSYYSNKPGYYFEEQPLCFLLNRVYWNVKYQKSMFEDDGNNNRFHRFKFDLLVKIGYKSWYKRIKKYDYNIKRYEKKLLETCQIKALNQLLEQVIGNFCGYIGIDHFRFLGITQILYKKLEKALEDIGYQKQDIFKFIGSRTSLNKTVTANRELLELATIINSNSNLLELFTKNNSEVILQKLAIQKEFYSFHNIFHRFIEKHGHRGVDCDDLYFPHWKEDQTNVIKLIKQYLHNGVNLGEPEDINLEIKNRKLKRLINLTGEYMCLRENQRYYFDKSWLLIRQILLKIAEYYKELQVIENAQDIFHMTIDEIQDGIRYPRYVISKDIVVQRKYNYEAAYKSSPPYMLKDSRNIPVQKNTRTSSYKVLSVSNGKAIGRIRVIHSLDELGEVKKGEIGIVKTFHPSWTPILKILSGLIMNYGNMLSHGAVVAREYSLPVVVFNGDAASVLKDGDLVELNATIGRVKVL